MDNMHGPRAAPAVLQCLLPSLIIAYFFIAELASLCSLSSSPQRANERPKYVISVLQAIILIVYVAEVLTLAVDTLCCGSLNSSAAGNVSLIESLKTCVKPIRVDNEDRFILYCR